MERRFQCVFIGTPTCTCLWTGCGGWFAASWCSPDLIDVIGSCMSHVSSSFCFSLVFGKAGWFAAFYKPQARRCVPDHGRYMSWCRSMQALAHVFHDEHCCALCTLQDVRIFACVLMRTHVHWYVCNLHADTCVHMHMYDDLWVISTPQKKNSFVNHSRQWINSPWIELTFFTLGIWFGEKENLSDMFGDPCFSIVGKHLLNKFI